MQETGTTTGAFSSDSKMIVPITTNIKFSIPRRFIGGTFPEVSKVNKKDLLVQIRNDLDLHDIWNYKVLLTIFKENGDDLFPIEMAMTGWIDSDGNTYTTDEPLVEMCMRFMLFVYLHNNTQDMLHMQTDEYIYEDLRYCCSLLEKRLTKLPNGDRFRVLYTVFSRRFEFFELLFRANDILFFWLSQTVRPFKTERKLEKDLNTVNEILQKIEQFSLPEKFQKCIEDRFKLPDSSSDYESDWKITINKLTAKEEGGPCTSFEKSAGLFSMSGWLSSRIFNSTRFSTSMFFYGQTTFLTPSEIQKLYMSASKINAKLKNGVYIFDKNVCSLNKKQTSLTIKKSFPKFSLWIENPKAYLRSVHLRLQSAWPCWGHEARERCSLS